MKIIKLAKGEFHMCHMKGPLMKIQFIKQPFFLTFSSPKTYRVL